MMKKSELSYERDKVMYAMVGEYECIGEEIANISAENLQEQYDAYKDSLCEIDCMIQHFIDIGNAVEVALMRKMAMHTKMVMREIKKKIMDANTTQKEIVYS